MTRIRLKGLNRKRVTLADGRTVEYWYAYKGGPRLPGKPGSPEFVAAYNEAVHAKIPPRLTTLGGLAQAYEASGDFAGLAPRTKDDYLKQLRKIDARFKDFPVDALKDRRTRGVFLAWRDELAKTAPRQADYAWSVLTRVLAWSLNRGLIETNPCEKGGKLHKGNRADKVWSKGDEAAFLARAPEHLALAFQMALWTGQRQGDLLAMTWSCYDGECIRWQQQKTGVRVEIPILDPLKSLLDARRGKPLDPILQTTRGTRWTTTGFQTSWRKVCLDAGVRGVTFHDLRGTAVTRLAVASATEAQIAALTGHSTRDVRNILDSNYLHRDPALSREAMRRRVAHENSRTPSRT
ncbi:tyrosine-type recombinase/integrase [Elstera sp.]|jgi:integrase|uniref:tyrosine-type recombinase/integrase n=1 Tax=Elstera sp. TaxID=1916664 RepID=UPI0037BFD9EB